MDDNRDLLATIRSALNRLDEVEVEAYEDPRAALARLRERPFDLALLDIRMPHVDGISLLGHCRALHPGIRVILMTAFATVQQAVEMMRLGADYYLSKPFSPDTVRGLVSRFLQEAGGAGPAAPDGEFLTADASTNSVLRRAFAAAESEASVLIRGESGTGKELLARGIHAHSHRRSGPFEVLNSAAMPESLVEAMLFGYERGAFTGAVRSVPGRIESAEGGTLFIDEVGDMSLPAQAKVLRVLQDKTFQRLGDTKNHTADVRYVFATNRDLHQMMEERSFREDLYYRIGVVEVTIPSLRDRPGDVALLARHFLARYAAEEGKTAPELTPDGLAALVACRWPGNVRQLQNFCRRTLIFAPPGQPLGAETVSLHLPREPRDTNSYGSTHVDRERLAHVLAAAKGNVSQAAKALGISRPTLYAWMKKHGLDRPSM